ncbi:MAG: hypothetical protein FD124_312 [Alphaproteobacteria bacterium]|nr:MAG: hypothetical protein FD160_250 [Caulobacteraceae bacterium]TPW08570.1 MAG: hypothetical protein FD124_312 [Alphaproteobacteria bacterium]
MLRRNALVNAPAMRRRVARAGSPLPGARSVRAARRPGGVRGPGRGDGSVDGYVFQDAPDSNTMTAGAAMANRQSVDTQNTRNRTMTRLTVFWISEWTTRRPT